MGNHPAALRAGLGVNADAKVLADGERNVRDGELKDGCNVRPAVLGGQNRMRVFEEEILVPAVAVTTSDMRGEALALANDALFGLGAGVWTRDINHAGNFGRDIQAGRVGANCDHLHPALPGNGGGMGVDPARRAGRSGGARRLPARHGLRRQRPG